MIIIDLSQTLMAVIMMNTKKGAPDKDMIRSMVFTTLLSYKKQFGAKFGAPVLALDSRVGYWRKDIFPNYKAHRKAAKEESSLDWKAIYDVMNTVTAEIQQCLPWKVVYVDKAEGDDIIGVLGLKYNSEPLLIISSDGDYKQLHTTPNVFQYAPAQKKWVTVHDVKKELLELIITGDKGDGIPNIKSDINCIVDGIRQSSITVGFLEDFHKNQGTEYKKHQVRFDMNEQLIDFTKIPQDIQDKIVLEFEKPPKGNINKLYQLFVSRKMSRMLGDIELFKIKEIKNDAKTDFFR
jgi:5'-3' exonuclease, N-terminal resolvase-like domain/T4 RNase H, C terminal